MSIQNKRSLGHLITWWQILNHFREKVWQKFLHQPDCSLFRKPPINTYCLHETEMKDFIYLIINPKNKIFKTNISCCGFKIYYAIIENVVALISKCPGWKNCNEEGYASLCGQIQCFRCKYGKKMYLILNSKDL